MNNRISNYFVKANTINHSQIEYVNTPIMSDAKLFIDPVLIETGISSFCKTAKIKLADYFKELHRAYYTNNDDLRKRLLLSHAQEINDSHLGYAKKYGHGNTENGLFDIFKGIDEYVNSVKISRLYELVLYIPNFAEDGMSDLLTNVLYKELSEFTLAQCKKQNIKTFKCPEERYFWDIETHSWKKYEGESLLIDDKICLLIPKEIVQTHYRFTTDNFLRSVIVENICEEAAIITKDGKKDRPHKDKVREQLIDANGSIFETIRYYAKQDNALLQQYQRIVDHKYQTMQLNDDTLDTILYS